MRRLLVVLSFATALAQGRELHFWTLPKLSGKIEWLRPGRPALEIENLTTDWDGDSVTLKLKGDNKPEFRCALGKLEKPWIVICPDPKKDQGFNAVVIDSQPLGFDFGTYAIYNFTADSLHIKMGSTSFISAPDGKGKVVKPPTDDIFPFEISRDSEKDKPLVKMVWKRHEDRKMVYVVYPFPSGDSPFSMWGFGEERSAAPAR